MINATPMDHGMTLATDGVTWAGVIADHNVPEGTVIDFGGDQIHAEQTWDAGGYAFKRSPITGIATARYTQLGFVPPLVPRETHDTPVLPGIHGVPSDAFMKVYAMHVVPADSEYIRSLSTEDLLDVPALFISGYRAAVAAQRANDTDRKDADMPHAPLMWLEMGPEAGIRGWGAYDDKLDLIYRITETAVG